MNPNTPKNSQQALAQLQKTQKGVQNPNQILESQQGAMGVTQARDTVGGLRGAINSTTQLLKQVAPSVMGRTGSSLVTQAQASRQIANEQAPISQNLTEQGQQYGEASQNLGELESKAAQAAQGIYAGQQDKLSYLQNIYNTLYQKEADARQAAMEKKQYKEEVRRFNEQLKLEKAQFEESRRQAARAAGGGFSLSGGSSSSTKPGSSKAAAGKAKAASSPQEKAFDFVQNMKGKSDSEVVSDFNAAKRWYEQTGDQTDYYKLLYYKQYFPKILGGASFNQTKGLRF